MAISLGASLALHSRQPLDDRTLFETLDELKSYPDNFLPTLFIAQVVEEPNSLFIYNKNNELDEELNHWRRFKSGDKVEIATLEKLGIVSVLQDGGILLEDGRLYLDDSKVPVTDMVDNPDVYYKHLADFIREVENGTFKGQN